MKKIVLLLALLVPAAACTAARANVAPEDHPALVVPPVPPRAIEPLPAEAPALEPVGDLPPASSSPARPRPQPREPNRPATADPKTETKPDTPPDPAAATPAPTTPTVPPLRTAGTSDGPETVRQIRDTLERADKTLSQVDYQALKPDSRQNYEQAKSFMKQADDALKANNVASAKALADRAETIAKLLKGG